MRRRCTSRDLSVRGAPVRQDDLAPSSRRRGRREPRPHMGTVLWYTIPIALAIALSVFPIVSVLVLLLAPDPMRRSVLFTGGWFGGLLVLVAAFTIGAALVPAEARGPFPPWAHVAEIAIGVVLIVMTLVIGRRARRSDSAKALDLHGLTTRMTGPRAFAFGVMMN